MEPPIPSWLNKEYFIEFLKQNQENFKYLQTLLVKANTKSGENYASNLIRIKLEILKGKFIYKKYI